MPTVAMSLSELLESYAGEIEMTRKDTILIAVVINAGLLAILFTTAVIYDTDKAIVPLELPTTLADAKPAIAEPAPALIAVASAPATTGDEVDNVLKYYASPSSQAIVVETQPETYVPEPIAVQANAPDLSEPNVSPIEAEQPNMVEVTVKKGDVLEKIARANKSSVSAIKKANNLNNEKLSIGQVLKIPVKKTSPAVVAEKPKEADNSATSNKATDASEPVYHVVKSGDNPWKIAKQYGVTDADILRLNQLNEEKARNLKIGDRIRVK